MIIINGAQVGEKRGTEVSSSATALARMAWVPHQGRGLCSGFQSQLERQGNKHTEDSEAKYDITVRARLVAEKMVAKQKLTRLKKGATAK